MLEVSVSGTVGTLQVDAQFQAASGVTCLFGASGAGKSTIANMIAGLQTPESGRIVIAGETVFDAAQGINLSVQDRRIGYVFQEARLFPHMSVRSNLTFSRWAARRQDSRSLEEVVELLGLEALLDRKPAHLSGGEKQRVAIGRALLSAPRLLIMDEPLSSLDQPRKQEILPYLDRICRETGLPILYISHAMEEVTRLATSLVLVDDGKTVASGLLADVLIEAGTLPAGSLLQGRSILEGEVFAIHQDQEMTEIDIAAEDRMQVTGTQMAQGASVRLVIDESDVAISLSRPQGVSIRNIVAAEVLDIRGMGAAQSQVLCALGQQRLTARITAAALQELQLRAGQKVFLLIKSASIEEHSSIARNLS